MSQLQFVGTKVPSDWIQKLKQLTEETGETQSAIVRDAIGVALGVTQETKVNPLRLELDELKLRVQALEESTRLSTVNPPIAVSTKTTPSPPTSEAMTIGELFVALKHLEYPHSQKTLSKHLSKAIESQQLPDDLIKFGVVANWEIKRSGSRYSNQLRWLAIVLPECL